MLTHFRQAFVALLLLTLITGVLYPLAVTAVAQLAFPREANGSMLGNGEGSELIAQPFDDPALFWSRPSATSPAYNGAASSGSNLAPSNPALATAVKARIDALRAAEPSNTAPIPIDLVTCSASGLDPHISPAAARYQVSRVASARGIADVRSLEQLVDQYTEQPTFGLLGEPRVNVLLLNRALLRAEQDKSERSQGIR